MSELAAFNCDKESIYIKLFPVWFHVLYLGNFITFNVGFLIISLSFSISIDESEFS